jgi:hypothetical protein
MTKLHRHVLALVRDITRRRQPKPPAPAAGVKLRPIAEIVERAGREAAQD